MPQLSIRHTKLRFVFSMKETVIRIMLEAGNKGISLRYLVLHVYNAYNSLFHPVSKEEVREYVYHLVRNHSTLPTDPFERIGWGRYRINLRSQKVIQAYIDFSGEQNECKSGEESSKQTGVDSPTLF